MFFVEHPKTTKTWFTKIEQTSNGRVFLFPSTFIFLKTFPPFFPRLRKRFHGHQGLDEIDLPTARLFAGSAGFRGQYLSKISSQSIGSESHDLLVGGFNPFEKC